MALLVADTVEHFTHLCKIIFISGRDITLGHLWVRGRLLDRRGPFVNVGRGTVKYTFR